MEDAEISASSRQQMIQAILTLFLRIATLTEDAEISASSRQRMIQEMAMMEARSDDLAAKLRQAEEKNNEMDRNQEAQKKEFEVRVVKGKYRALGESRGGQGRFVVVVSEGHEP